MSTKWIAVNPIPSPLPANWNNANVWIDASLNGVHGGGKVTLIDQSTVPPSAVSWSAFTGNPTNPDWVPTYDGPQIASSPGSSENISIIINMKKYKWAGTVTCVWHSSFWLVTGVNYESDAYPQ